MTLLYGGNLGMKKKIVYHTTVTETEWKISSEIKKNTKLVTGTKLKGTPNVKTKND